MKVTIRDHALESALWGRGGPECILRTITIPDTCAECGGPRGEPRPHRFCCDGDWFTVSIWDNPCGHRDPYDKVIKEAL